MAKQPKEQASSAAHKADHQAVIQAITTDEHAGKGGSYLFDPATGKRTPVKSAQVTAPTQTTKET